MTWFESIFQIVFWVLSGFESKFCNVFWVVSRFESNFGNPFWVMSWFESILVKPLWIMSWVESKRSDLNRIKNEPYPCLPCTLGIFRGARRIKERQCRWSNREYASWIGMYIHSIHAWQFPAVAWNSFQVWEGEGQAGAHLGFSSEESRRQWPKPARLPQKCGSPRIASYISEMFRLKIERYSTSMPHRLFMVREISEWHLERKKKKLKPGLFHIPFWCYRQV